MQPKLIRTHVGEYVPAEWNGKNESGMQPWGDRVLVLTDEFAGVTSGGIMVTDETKYKHDMAATTGVLVAIGDAAFTRNPDRTGPYVGKRPEAGHRVYFEQYGGAFYAGADGRMYRTMDDKVIGGGFMEGAAPAAAPKKPKPVVVTKVARPKLLMPA